MLQTVLLYVFDPNAYVDCISRLCSDRHLIIMLAILIKSVVPGWSSIPFTALSCCLCSMPARIITHTTPLNIKAYATLIMFIVYIQAITSLMSLSRQLDLLVLCGCVKERGSNRVTKIIS